MPVETRPNIEEASDFLKYPLGTRFVDSCRQYRYGLAGTNLRANKRAYAYFPEPGRGPPYDGRQMIEDFWGDIRSSCQKGCRLAGIPTIDISRGQYGWFRVRF